MIKGWLALGQVQGGSVRMIRECCCGQGAARAACLAKARRPGTTRLPSKSESVQINIGEGGQLLQLKTNIGVWKRLRLSQPLINLGWNLKGSLYSAEERSFLNFAAQRAGEWGPLHPQHPLVLPGACPGDCDLPKISAVNSVSLF